MSNTQRTLIAILLFLSASNASAVTYCRYSRGANRGQMLVLADGARCPAGTTKYEESSQIYGTGSSGDLNVRSSSGLGYLERSHNYDFQDVTISQGTTLTVLSGTVIRCRGNFTNNGTINVGLGAPGGFRQMSSPYVTNPTEQPAGASYFGGISSSSQYSNSVDTISGAPGTVFNLVNGHFLIRHPLVNGGGGGGAALGYAGSGGGLIFIICKGALVNSGLISSNGGDAGGELHLSGGGGGGAGGIIVIASGTSINHTGTISAQGANGGASYRTASFAVAPGGGGTGGIVELISPEVSNTGIINITPGNGGELLHVETSGAFVKISGAGGGSMTVAGGTGGGITDGQTISAASSGADGHSMVLEINPIKVLRD